MSLCPFLPGAFHISVSKRCSALYLCFDAVSLLLSSLHYFFNFLHQERSNHKKHNAGKLLAISQFNDLFLERILQNENRHFKKFCFKLFPWDLGKTERWKCCTILHRTIIKISRLCDFKKIYHRQQSKFNYMNCNKPPDLMP